MKESRKRKSGYWFSRMGQRQFTCLQNFITFDFPKSGFLSVSIYVPHSNTQPAANRRRLSKWSCLKPDSSLYCGPRVGLSLFRSPRKGQFSFSISRDCFQCPPPKSFFSYRCLPRWVHWSVTSRRRKWGREHYLIGLKPMKG